jgi:hypothetical protein
MTSRRFREKPYETTFGTEDPLTVLRQNPDGEAKVRAMRKLKEPAANGRPQAEQDEVVQILTDAATSDPSPWVRVAAIDALGRFKDPRTVETLALAFYQATGKPTTVSEPAPAIQQVGGRQPTLLADRLGLHGPQGFTGEQVMNIRGRAIDALAKTGRPEAVEFLARVAAGHEALVNEDPADRDFVRQHAVASLGKMRQKEAVAALAAPAVAARFQELGITPVGNTPEEFRAFVASETARWGEVARRAHIQLD